MKRNKILNGDQKKKIDRWKIIAIVFLFIIMFIVIRIIRDTATKSHKLEFPFWAYFLDDPIAQKCFISPEAHYKYVMDNGLEEKYKDFYKNIPEPSENNLDDFAKCLTVKGLVFYGNDRCPHCNDVKELFGCSFKYINYVECTENIEECQNAKIEKVPTFIINSQKYMGEKSLDQLSSITGCSI